MPDNKDYIEKIAKEALGIALYMLLASRYTMEDPIFTYVYSNMNESMLYQGV